jgi:hypothetical protein
LTGDCCDVDNRLRTMCAFVKTSLHHCAAAVDVRVGEGSAFSTQDDARSHFGRWPARRTIPGTMPGTQRAPVPRQPLGTPAFCRSGVRWSPHSCRLTRCGPCRPGWPPLHTAGRPVGTAGNPQARVRGGGGGGAMHGAWGCTRVTRNPRMGNCSSSVRHRQGLQCYVCRSSGDSNPPTRPAWESPAGPRTRRPVRGPPLARTVQSAHWQGGAAVGPSA